MQKKILLIEAEKSFADRLSEALGDRGFDVVVTSEGKDGIVQAHELLPDAIVLCVELPKTSGYSICNKIKKDDALKHIPLVLTSSEATPDTFEQHRKLKTHADAYLVKPFDSEELLEKLAELLGEVAHLGDDDLISIDDEALSIETEIPPELELSSSNDLMPLGDADDSARTGDTTVDSARSKPFEPPSSSDDVDVFDSAFDSIELDRPGAEKAEVSPSASDWVDAALASLPEEPLGLAMTAESAIDLLGSETIPKSKKKAPGASAVDAPSSFRSTPVSNTENLDEVDLLDPFGSLQGLDEKNAPGLLGTASEVSALHNVSEYMARVAELQEQLTQKVEEVDELKLGSGGSSSQSKEVISLKASLNQKDKEILQLKQELNQREGTALGMRERETELEGAQRTAEEALKERDGQIKVLKGRLEGFSSAAKKLENELKLSKEELRKVLERATSFEKELAISKARIEDLDNAASEADELRKRVTKLESAAELHEERVMRAFQKIKADENSREKVRKALKIALQLVEDQEDIDASTS